MLNKLQTLWNNRFDYTDIHGKPLIKLAILSHQVNRFYRTFGEALSDPYGNKSHHRIVPAQLEADYFLINAIRFDIFCILEAYEDIWDSEAYRIHGWLTKLDRALHNREDYILESEEMPF